MRVVDAPMHTNTSAATPHNRRVCDSADQPCQRLSLAGGSGTRISIEDTGKRKKPVSHLLTICE